MALESVRIGWIPATTGVIVKWAEALAEQVEAADLILVNKVDLASGEEIKTTSTMAHIEPKAEMVQVEFR
jgi:G3E family GTPase